MAAHNPVTIMGVDSAGNSVAIELTAGAVPVTDPNTINLIDDTSSATYTYFGSAPADSLFASAVWQVRRMTNSTGSTFPVAGGALIAWNDRLTATYNTGS